MFIKFLRVSKFNLGDKYTKKTKQNINDYKISSNNFYYFTIV